MQYVVGSGPAGTACAKALLERGEAVTMLDTGLDLDADRERHRASVAAVQPEQWPPESVAAVTSGILASPSGVPLKLVFGSDFPFRVPPQAENIRQAGTHVLRSFARGGLSRAWGATLLPMAAGDIAGWPVSLSDLAPHYRAVMTWVPVSGAADDLDELFLLYTDAPGDLRPSRPAQDILDELGRHRRDLRAKGVVFGRARLAVQAPARGGSEGCNYCRLCLYGCPYGRIFTADQALDDLQRHPRFSYSPGMLVKAVRETSSEVEIHATDLTDGQARRFNGDRVFLACGVVTTSQLLMRTLEIDEVRIRTSQSFLMPLIKHQANRDVRGDRAHALTQVYLLVQDPAVARRLVQLQIYTHSDLVSAALERSFAGLLFRHVPWLKHQAEDRVAVLQGLLPSEDSDDIVLTRHGEDFSMTGSVTSHTRDAVRRVADVCRTIGPLGGFRALTPLLRLSAPGQSFHSGASFPMSSAPDRSSSDLLGRAGGLGRIHAVDATVLPDIPAPPLTLTVMANAHRIGSLAGRV